MGHNASKADRLKRVEEVLKEVSFDQYSVQLINFYCVDLVPKKRSCIWAFREFHKIDYQLVFLLH